MVYGHLPYRNTNLETNMNFSKNVWSIGERCRWYRLLARLPRKASVKKIRWSAETNVQKPMYGNRSMEVRRVDWQCLVSYWLTNVPCSQRGLSPTDVRVGYYMLDLGLQRALTQSFKHDIYSRASYSHFAYFRPRGYICLLFKRIGRAQN